jgi:hypothetical protein
MSAHPTCNIIKTRKFNQQNYWLLYPTPALQREHQGHTDWEKVSLSRPIDYKPAAFTCYFLSSIDTTHCSRNYSGVYMLNHQTNSTLFSYTVIKCVFQIILLLLITCQRGSPKQCCEGHVSFSWESLTSTLRTNQTAYPTTS